MVGNSGGGRTTEAVSGFGFPGRLVVAWATDAAGAHGTTGAFVVAGAPGPLVAPVDDVATPPATTPVGAPPAGDDAVPHEAGVSGRIGTAEVA